MIKKLVMKLLWGSMLLFTPLVLSQTAICPIALAEESDNETIVAAVQNALNNLGYDCGTADGVAGEKTITSIRQYQEENRLTVSGSIDEELLSSLGLLETDPSMNDTAENEIDNIEEIPANAAGTFEYEILDDGTAMITKYDGSSDLIIPEEIDGYAVSEIKEGAFDYDSFDTVVFPASIQKIGKKAFNHATIKSGFTIPENVVIESDAFRGAELSDDVVIGSGATIGENAFAYSSGIENLSLSEGVTVEEKAFYYAEDLNSVMISGGVTIEEDAFRDSETQNFTILEDYDSSLNTLIGETAFAYCNKLNTVVLPANTVLDKKVFYYAEISDSLIFDGYIDIGEDAFRDAELPEDLVIPANSIVGETAFAYTEGTKNLTINENTQVEEQAFYYADDLVNVNIMSNVVVGKDAFRDTTIREVTISENCELKSGAFAYISKLETANIAESVSVEDDTFEGSDPLIEAGASALEHSPEDPEMDVETNAGNTVESTEGVLSDEDNELPTINDLNEAQSLQEICNFIAAEETALEENQKKKTDEALALASSYTDYKENKPKFPGISYNYTA